jgi:drug/metabolite transporter (DMT)-like permease
VRRFKTWQLFAICVLVWGTTWHAITYQLHDFAAESGVALRFALAGLAVLALCRWRGVPLGCSLGDHGALALQGVFLYGVSYVCVYHAERFVPSGLVAVGYSASPLLAGVGAALLFGASLSRRFVIGGLLGLCGVVVIFWTEITRASGDDRAALGALFTVASVLLSAVGSLAASRNRKRGLALLPAMGFGMLYGAIAAAAATLAFGRSLVLPTAPGWWLSLGYLAFAGSVLTFACFLTLQDRVGPGPAGTVGVMTPLLALIVSLAFEGFRPDLLTALGAALAVAGNALMLRPAPSSPAPAGAAAREAG